MKIVALSHDGFARQEVIRRTVHTTAKCACCGENRKGRLFQYGISPDGFGAHDRWEAKTFCSKNCRDAYHCY